MDEDRGGASARLSLDEVAAELARLPVVNGRPQFLDGRWVDGKYVGGTRIAIVRAMAADDDDDAATAWIGPGLVAYDDYLRTQHWHRVAMQALRRARGRCQICARTGPHICVHHNNYDCLTNEFGYDVFVVCGRHHDAIHLHPEAPRAPSQVHLKKRYALA